MHLSQGLSYLALSSSHTPVPCCLLYCPSTRSSQPHTQQVHPWDDSLTLLSAVQSLLTELSLDGKRERKQLSAAGEELSSDSWLVNWSLMPNPELDGLGGEREKAQCKNTSAPAHGALHRQMGSVFPLRTSGVIR